MFADAPVRCPCAPVLLCKVSDVKLSDPLSSPVWWSHGRFSSCPCFLNLKSCLRGQLCVFLRAGKREIRPRISQTQNRFMTQARVCCVRTDHLFRVIRQDLSPFPLYVSLYLSELSCPHCPHRVNHTQVMKSSLFLDFLFPHKFNVYCWCTWNEMSCTRGCVLIDLMEHFA